MNTYDEHYEQQLIIFDGVCNFCNASINFIIERDPEAKFVFTTVQGHTGSTILNELNIDPLDPNTFVLIKHKKAFIKSDAVLEISQDLVGPWRFMIYFNVVPRTLRDLIYKLIANNRYKLMGKRDKCMIPSSDLKARFID